MKKIICCLLICCITANASAQHKPVGYIDAGLSMLVPWNYHSKAAGFPAITISPGIKVVQGKDFAAIINAPVSIGWRFKDNGYLGIDLPFMLNFHFGSATTNNGDAKWGLIMGAGAAYINVVNYYDDFIKEKVHAEFWGYRFKLGVSFKPDEDGTVIPALVISYGKGISNGRDHVIGIGLQVMMGNAKKKNADQPTDPSSHN